MATITDPQTTTLVSEESDHPLPPTTANDPQVDNKSFEEATHSQAIIPLISEDAQKGEVDISVKKPEEKTTAVNQDEVPVVAEVSKADPAPGLEVPVEAVPVPKEIIPPIPEPETITTLDSTSIVVDEQPEEKPEIVASEDVQEKLPALEVAESEMEIKIEPETVDGIPEDKLTSSEVVHKEPEEKLAVEEVEKEKKEKSVSEAVEGELEKKPDVDSTQREVEVVESELKEKPALEVAETKPEVKAELEVVGGEAKDSAVLEIVHKELEEKLKVDGVEKETTEKSVSEAVEGELEEKPDVESTQREVEMVEAELKEKPALEVAETEPEVKTELEVAGGEAKDSAVLEVVQNELKEPIAIESTEKQVEEKRDIVAKDPIPSTEVADEPVQKVEDLPLEDLKPEIKKELEEISEPEPQEVKQSSTVNEVIDGPQVESQESKVVAKEVEEKSKKDEKGKMTADEGGNADEEENNIRKPQEYVIDETYEPVPSNEEAGADAVNSEAEKTLADELDTTARGLDVVNVMSNEDGNAGEGEQQKDVIVEENADKNAKQEELVPSKTENGVNVVDGQLKDESLAEEEKQEKDVKGEEILEEKIRNPEELVQSETTRIEDASGSFVGKEISDKSFEGEQISRDMEVVKDEAKELKDENTGALEPEGESKGSRLETKVEETIKDGANESESTKETADEGKPAEPPTLEPSKDAVDETVASKELPKTEVVTKSTHKSSGNILSKVKQSIVKVKKAITGKSPSSKTASAEPKVEETAK